MEIEKKYIIKDIPKDLNAYEKHFIIQGYICTEPVIRIRKIDTQCYLTCKSNGLMIREEFETSITEEAFNHLSKKIDYPLITKKRYIIPFENNLKIELDVFEGRLLGLVLAEVEFTTELQALNFSPPNWFEDDVTFNPKFQNNYLCKLEKYV